MATFACGNTVSIASSSVSATNPGEWTAIGSCGRPSSVRAWRYSSAYGANRAGSPPMTASASGNPKRAARTTDCGLPPTPIHAGIRPDSVFGYTCRSASPARTVPSHVTASSVSSRAMRSSFSVNSRS